MPEFDAAVVLTLATLFAENRIDGDAIRKALEVICTAVACESGIVYGLSDTNQYLQEELFQRDSPLRPCPLSAEYFTLGERKVLAGQVGFFYRRSEENSPLERYFLDLRESDAVLLAPVTDEEAYLYGFILFSEFSEAVDGEKLLQAMAAPISLLTRYVGVRMLQKRIRRSRVTLENILDNTNIDIYVNDYLTHEILYVNESMAAPYGGKRKFDGQICWQVLYPGQTKPCEFCPKHMLIDEQGLPTKVYSWDYQRPFDGSWFRVFSAAFPWENGRLAHIVSSANITDNKRNEALIENMANYDQLTKLPNRRMLVKECEKRIDKATETEQGYVLFFDIDGFKAINDTLGHDSGDDFLISLGQFFSEIPILENSIYRNGGDEFVAIVGGEDITKVHIRDLAHLIHERFRKPWRVRNGEARCGVSIGVACFPEDGRTAEVLLQKADQAMYFVKNKGGNDVCFGYEMGEDKFA